MQLKIELTSLASAVANRLAVAKSAGKEEDNMFKLMAIWRNSIHTHAQGT
jgi:hypothetical protein